MQANFEIMKDLMKMMVVKIFYALTVSETISIPSFRWFTSVLIIFCSTAGT